MAGETSYQADPPGTAQPSEEFELTASRTPKARLVSGELKSSQSTKTLDFAHLTRKSAFEARLAGTLEMEQAAEAAKKLQEGSDVDDLAKFTRSGSKADMAKAAEKYVKKQTSASWVPTLIAVKGRALPVFPMLWAVSIATAATCTQLLYLHNSKHFEMDTACPNDHNADKMCYPYTLEIPYTVVAAVGGALFFLMVFRTNASYDRWWEGRKKWGMIINRTRDFARQSVGFVDEYYLVDNMVRWTVAFAICTKRHLRFERKLDELEGRLAPEEIARIQEAKHMPLYCLERLSTYCRLARESPRNKLVTDIVFIAMDHNLTQFEDELGACERILKTPFPYAYVVHLRTFMTLWLAALPFALLGVCGWLTIPTVACVAYALLGIETIGVEIENPFGHDFNDLPLDTICETISTNLFELLARRVKAFAVQADEQRTMMAKAEQVWTALELVPPVGERAVAMDLAKLASAIGDVLEGESNLRESGLRAMLGQAERELDMECQVRLLDDGKKAELGGAVDLQALCTLVKKAN